jgi:hypothetical protein
MRALGSIETGSKNRFQQENDVSGSGAGPFVHSFCPASAQPVPNVLPPLGEAAKVSAAEWDTPTWTCLKFSLEEPQSVQLAYETNGKTGPDARYVAIARRRVPSGKIRTYRLEGRGDQTGDAVRVSFTQTDD